MTSKSSIASCATWSKRWTAVLILLPKSGTDLTAWRESCKKVEKGRKLVPIIVWTPPNNAFHHPMPITAMWIPHRHPNNFHSSRLCSRICEEVCPVLIVVICKRPRQVLLKGFQQVVVETKWIEVEIVSHQTLLMMTIWSMNVNNDKSKVAMWLARWISRSQKKIWRMNWSKLLLDGDPKAIT